MVKILGICGSPRRKSSYVALQAALEAAGASIAKKHGSGSEKSICNFVKKGVYSFEEKIN